MPRITRLEASTGRAEGDPEARFPNTSRPKVNELPEPFGASRSWSIRHSSLVVGKSNAELLHDLGQRQPAQRG
jgi:hypothetical protein